MAEAEKNTIFVMANPDSKGGFWDVNKQHPGGEVFVSGADVVEVAVTSEVSDALKSGRLVETDAPEDAAVVEDADNDVVIEDSLEGDEVKIPVSTPKGADDDDEQEPGLTEEEAKAHADKDAADAEAKASADAAAAEEAAKAEAEATKRLKAEEKKKNSGNGQ